MAALTIKDIAKMCGVGVSTVSRAINDDPGINEQTKKRILKVIAEQNYVPNNSARNLKRTDSNTIALLVKGIDNQFFLEMLAKFEEKLKEFEYSFMIQPVNVEQDDAKVAVELAKEKRLKGVIFLGGLMDTPEETLNAMGIPYVLCTVAVNLDAPKRQCSTISINDKNGGYIATDYLCKAGHKKIAMLAGREADYSVARLRLEGYMQALKDNEIEFDPELVRFMSEDIPEYSIENGYVTTKKLLESGLDFTAIYAISDVISMGAYKAIYEAGKRIPEDYSIIGFDGIDMGNFYHPSLTTVKQPIDDMVAKTIELLMKQIDGDKTTMQVIYEAEVLERNSVKKM
ncbi:MAG: LacI family transcriptional regulator [Lachnospiraceae bacterium]|nr:LacI family transcriptional regulator [Lachnospiraceae bacterium]